MRDLDLKLQGWRIACRHIDIRQTTGETARFLARQTPLAGLTLRRLDGDRQALDTVADTANNFEGDEQRLTVLPGTRFRQLIERCRVGHSWHDSGRKIVADRLARDIMANSRDVASSDVVIEPLIADGEPVGVLVLISSPENQFSAKHRAMFRCVLEPLAASLVNDRQLHDVMTQRDVAEADKRSLLSRLGREQLGDTIVGEGEGLRQVMERIELVARSNLTVLILGETGSGKEVVARAVHTRSAYSDGPFVRVNCGAIPPDLIDSELFGHEKGSFTGASDSRQGWFERADHGTLLLDEIGELPAAAQVRLLRVLQDGSFVRVGGKTSVNVDVRIIAATHRNLPSMIDSGRFREDLWYRISAFPIRIPPLRERTGDIAALASHLAHRAARRFGMPSNELSPTDIQSLISYSWPGNVRELAAVIDRAVILGGGQRLEIALALGQSPAPPALSERLRDDAEAPAPKSRLAPLNDVMAQHIRTVLRATDGRIEGTNGAAQILGINPHTLRARMRKLGLDWRVFRAKSIRQQPAN